MKRKKHFLKVTRGSLTVEAALVLPVFIYIIITFMYFLQVIRIQENLQHAITETGYYAAKYAYVYDYILEYEADVPDNNETDEHKGETDLEDGQEEDTGENRKSQLESTLETVIAKSIDSAYYKVKMQDYLDINIINHSCVENGIDGIHTYLSGFMKEDDAVDIILTYDIRLPLLFINPEDIPVMQRVRLRGWNGHKVDAKNSSPDTGNDNEEMVYITETGTVYHLYKDCTYLNLSIREADIGQIDALRNDSGGKYKKCSLCGDSGTSGQKTVYITDTGDRYHYSLNCSGLKRTIITIPISEIGDRNLCSRCGARNK